MPESRPGWKKSAAASWMDRGRRASYLPMTMRWLTMEKVDLSRYFPVVEAARPLKFHGKVTHVVGLVIEGYCPDASVGALCEIYPRGSSSIPAEVVGFRDNKTLLMPLGELRGVGLGSLISVRREKAPLSVGPALLGRVINGLGMPVDDPCPIVGDAEYPIYA